MKLLFNMLFIVFPLSALAQEFPKSFDALLGKEKSLVFDKAVESFEQFLDENFKDLPSDAEQIKKFLEYYKHNDFSPNPNWKYDTLRNQEVLMKFESSGLRKEIWLKNAEKYKPVYNLDKFKAFYAPKDNTKNDAEIEIDMEVPETSNEKISENANRENTINNHKAGSGESIEKVHFNLEGAYILGLWKFYRSNAIVGKYIELSVKTKGLSPYIIVNGFLDLYSMKDFNDPAIKKILVAEIYYFLLSKDIDKSK